ncbi:cobaltochelatase subunit CobN [Alloprevotella sp. OH1205_COT-284]|uniref:cobaltochelatase subunit CobN n=1 Tax=Alloprevotella sp. OH1205_COT-284 TaxID=2491043 RepID=UPI000F6014B9|nr:cobaltochelatase subunit CobN [Alloprevotella sp. OH1205_COT-284]RRD79900.1 cobaltochelatase subunit CobN [Alloprevotella sp. OH1205_COT-284]
MDKNKIKKIIAIGLSVLFVAVAATFVWRTWMGTTRVAFVNFQTLTLGHIAKANDNGFISVEGVNADNIEDIGKYDMVFINAMGLRITEAQRAKVQDLADNGLPIMAVMVTNPANGIVSIDTAHVNKLGAYLSNGGRENYRNLLRYVRKYIDGKWIKATEPSPAVERINSLLYHIDPQKPDDEELGFNSVKDYEAFLRRVGLWKDKAARIVVTGMMGQPAELVAELEKQNNVYHVDNLHLFIKGGHIDSIRPSAIVNMAHGRMGDGIVAYLERQNIPLFSPINTQSQVENWEKNPMGLSGGYLSQTVAMPELDGALLPYAVFGHQKDKEGLLQVFAMPQRVRDFVKTINQYVGLKSKPNKDKRIAIFYLKGPGQSSLVAQGMEVVPSLYNLLKALKADGYKVDNLPASHKELERMIQTQGAVLGTYAKGAFDEFMKKGKPELITRAQYEEWVSRSLRPEKYKEVVAASGEFPGEYLATADGRLGVPRLQFGNVVLLPQMMSGSGSDHFKIVHGTDAAPPHVYIASYLWTQFGFGADALIHFGTHGSLEFTPRKQVALSSLDWSDRLVGTLPHFYLYSIANVGEGIIAKRRSYAALQSYLTPPFLESNLRNAYRELDKSIHQYNALQLSITPSDDPKGKKQAARNEAALRKAALDIKRAAVKMGVHRDLGLDSVLSRPYSEDDIARLETFAEEIANEKITGQPYVLGVAYDAHHISGSVHAMAADPIAYSLLALDKLRKRATVDSEKHSSVFTTRYLNPAKALVGRLLANPALATDELICATAHLTPAELQRARDTYEEMTRPAGGMMAAMMAQAAASKAQSGKGQQKANDKKPSAAMMAMMKTAKALGMKPPHGHGDAEAAAQKPTDKQSAPKGHPKGMQADKKKNGMPQMSMPKPRTFTREEKTFAYAVMEVERTIKNVNRYANDLKQSPTLEIQAVLNSLRGGYTSPSPGGDPVANPNSLPSGRNMYAINAEATPSEAAWEKGKQLAKNTLDLYRRRHNDSLPRKVSYTFWSSEFIETEGATIAQALYMLGVEPIRDAFGRVNDLRLIPSKELGRPRIDVVVQTSGQLRDLAASRLFLLQRAVEMAAAAKGDDFTNEVAEGVVESERALIDRGVSPKVAREIAARRVFGGVNGNYGTGIQGMVMASDKWSTEQEIAEVYLNNMNAYYGDQKKWEEVQQHAFAAALTRTDVVIQPRQNNTWGALSLDHVFEFMGGMNLSVRNITGKDPDAYLSDYRNRNRVRMQEVKEAIGVESRTTIFNPTYIREQMKGEAGAAGGFEEFVRNTFGWEVMKPNAIDNELWDEIYNVYVADKFDLGMRKYFEQKNPAALQGITAIMLESVRKGMWKANATQVAELAKLHTELIADHKAACTGFVCNNAALRKFISQKVDAATAQTYQKQIDAAIESRDKNGTVLKKEEQSSMSAETRTNLVSGIAVGIAVIVLLVALVIFVRRRRRNLND